MPSPYMHDGLWFVRVPRSDRRVVKTSTGTTDKRTAKAIGNMVDALAARGESAILDAVCRRQMRLLPLYTRWCTDSRLADTKAEVNDGDLEPYVAEWGAHLAQRGIASGVRYVAQVRLLIPEGTPYRRSRFTRRTISEHLAGLGVTGSTFNRHRSGLLQFARFLVEREVLETNPVRDVRASRENPARDTIYTMEDVQRLVAALPAPYRALEALLSATGIEMQAALRLRRRDLDLSRWQLHARGSKTAWRNRVVVVSEAWAMPILAEHIRGLLPDALLFGTVTHDAAIDAHHAACKAKAVALPHSTLHDHRHHFAVAALKRGTGYAFVAHQLGHHNTMLAQQRYGRYVPDAEELHRSALAGSGRTAKKSRAVAQFSAQSPHQPNT